MHNKFTKDAEKACRNLIASFDQVITCHNPYFSPELAKYLFRSLAPFSPLWSSFVHSRMTNNLIEARHKVIKYNLFNGTVNLSPSIAIRDLRAEVIAQIKNVKSEGILKNKRTKTIIDLPVESFKSIKKPKVTNFKRNETAFIRIDFDTQNRNLSKEINCLQFDTSFVAQTEGICLQKRDFKILLESKWLNDNIVVSYLNLVKSSATFVFDSIILQKICELGIENSNYLLHALDLSGNDQVIFPINKNRNHWVVCFANMKTFEVLHYDSFKGDSSIEINVILAILQRCTENIEWKIQQAEGWPVQTNGFDCGVFILEAARRLSLGLEMSNNFITSENSLKIRQRIALELVNSVIITKYDILF